MVELCWSHNLNLFVTCLNLYLKCVERFVRHVSTYWMTNILHISDDNCLHTLDVKRLYRNCFTYWMANVVSKLLSHSGWHFYVFTYWMSNFIFETVFTYWMSKRPLVVPEAAPKMPSHGLCQFLCINSLKLHENPIQSLRETSVREWNSEVWYKQYIYHHMFLLMLISLHGLLLHYLRQYNSYSVRIVAYTRSEAR